MAKNSEGTDSVRQLLIQRLESLQRSGVLGLPRRGSTSTSGDIEKPSISEPNTGQVAISPAAETSELALQPPASAHSATKAAIKNPSEKTADLLPVDKRPARESKAGGSSAALAAMQIEVAACRRCEHLACKRTKTVFGVGNQRPRLCFIGEAPGADEDRLGEPFVGRAGQLLTDIIEKGMQLKRSDIYILNVLKCRPPDNRPPTDEEIANCREYFERQLELLQPEFICLLGATAARAVLNTKQALGRLRGQWFTYGNARVMVTYHPSYLLRNPPAKKDTWEDIQMLMREMGLPVGKMS